MVCLVSWIKERRDGRSDGISRRLLISLTFLIAFFSCSVTSDLALTGAPNQEESAAISQSRRGLYDWPSVPNWELFRACGLCRLCLFIQFQNSSIHERLPGTVHIIDGQQIIMPTPPGWTRRLNCYSFEGRGMQCATVSFWDFILISTVFIHSRATRALSPWINQY